MQGSASCLADGFFTTEPPGKPVVTLTGSQIVPSLARGSISGWALSSFNKKPKSLTSSFDIWKDFLLQAYLSYVNQLFL